MAAKRKMRRVLDFAIYIAVGLGVVTIAIALAEYQHQLGIAKDDLYKLIGAGATTLVVFPTVVQQNWQRRREGGFWPVLGVLLMAHVVLLAMLWRFPGEIKAPWWGLLVAVEIECGSMVLQSLRSR